MRIMGFGSIVVGVIVIGSMSIPAHSRTQSGMAGHGPTNTVDGCLFGVFSEMFNICSDASHNLTIPVQVPASPASVYILHAVASGNGAGAATSCQAVAHDMLMSGIWFSSTGTTDTTLTVQRLSLGAITVPNSGTLYFACSLAPGSGRVINVEFTTPGGI